MGGFHEGLDNGLDRLDPVDWALRERHGCSATAERSTTSASIPAPLPPTWPSPGASVDPGGRGERDERMTAVCLALAREQSRRRRGPDQSLAAQG
jgi:hypothetical protein